MLLAKRREEGCTGRYSKGLGNQNGEHLFELDNIKTQVLSLATAIVKY